MQVGNLCMHMLNRAVIEGYFFFILNQLKAKRAFCNDKQLEFYLRVFMKEEFFDFMRP